MSKDSGLPVYNEVPNYTEFCNPKWLSGTLEEQKKFTSFQGKALQNYRNTKPHSGYQILKEFSKTKGDVYCLTSNVDCALQKAGFENVDEIHGNLEKWQCSKPCRKEIFEIGDFDFEWNNETGMKLKLPLYLLKEFV